MFFKDLGLVVLSAQTLDYEVTADSQGVSIDNKVTKTIHKEEKAAISSGEVPSDGMCTLDGSSQCLKDRE